MDNASKALIMAGGLLIAVLIISLAMYIVNVFRDYNENASLLNRSSQDEAYNRYFEYSFHDVDPTIPDVQIYGYDVHNLIQKVLDIDEDNDYYDTDQVSTFAKGPSIQFGIINTSTASIIRQYLLPSFSGDNLSKKYTYRYQYGNNGRINTIIIEE